MNVYILTAGELYDGGSVAAVFDDLDAALRGGEWQNMAEGLWFRRVGGGWEQVQAFPLTVTYPQVPVRSGT